MPSKMNPSNHDDKKCAAWQPDGRPSGNLLLDSGKKDSRGIPGRHSQKWSVRGNHSPFTTVKFPTFPATNDGEIDTSTPPHHDNDTKQPGLFGCRGLLCNETPTDTTSVVMHRSYKDALMSRGHIVQRRRRKRRRRRRKRNRLKDLASRARSYDEALVDMAVKEASRMIVSSTSTTRSSTGSIGSKPVADDEWRFWRETWRQLRQRSIECEDFHTSAGEMVFIELAICEAEEDADNFEVAPNQEDEELRQFLRNVLELIKAARTRDCNRVSTIDEEPRRATAPDLNSDGFRKGWTSRESMSNLGSKKTPSRLESTAEAPPPRQQASTSVGRLPTIDEAMLGHLIPTRSVSVEECNSTKVGFDDCLLLTHLVTFLNGRSTPATWSYPYPSQSQPLGFFGFRGLVYNEAPKISSLIEETAGDFRSRSLTYGVLPNAKQGPLQH